MSVRFICIVFCLYFACGCDAARILGLFPMPAPSHYILGHALLKGLAEAGHDVTMVSPYAVKDLPKNGTWRDVLLDGMVEDFQKMQSNIDFFKKESEFPPMHLVLLNVMGKLFTEKTLSHKNVQTLIKSGEKFDVVIVSQFVIEGVKTLANHFNGHLILLSNTAPNSLFNHLVGNPSLPSFYPEVLLGLPKQMNFFHRLYNTLFKMAAVVSFHLYLYPEHDKLSKKYIPNAVDLSDALYNVSLVLANSHSSIFDPQPLVPCIVEIGGYHINPLKKLPDDLQKYLDDAKEGVIYFSMGSNLKSKLLPVEKREALLKAFGKRKEKVLWKWEDDILPGQPPNVRLGKWLPQQEILAHPNVKVFITHGGLGSTIETIYHGVPIVAIPVIADQKMNAKSAEQAGFGLVLPFPQLTEQTLTSLLDEVISNPKYRDNVKERSRIMRDRQVPPLQNAIYWVEYVIRHNGAKHLRVAYLDLSWYQYYLLDVFAFIFAVLFGIFILIKKGCSYLCRPKSKKDKRKVKVN